MSSFNDLFKKVQMLNEAKTSPYAAAHQSFGGVTKTMREGGLSSAPLDTIKFIREILFNLDVISEEELQSVKSAKGFTGKKQAMLAVLKANQETINAKTDEIAQTVESTLDDFISGMGVNRSREEKYAAQAASQEIAAEVRKAKSGKEMDDALVDIVSDEKLLVKASLAKAIQELEDLPAGEDLSPDVINNIKEFAPKINNIDQFEAFVKQMGEMEEYQIPAYHLSGTVKALKGGLEDIEMEDQEDPDDLQARVDAAVAEGGIDKRDAHDITRNLRNGEDAEREDGTEDGEYELDDEAHEMLSRAEDILGNLEDQGFDDLAANGMDGAQEENPDAEGDLYNLQDQGWTQGSAAWHLSRDIVRHGRKAMPQTEDAEGSIKQEVRDAITAHAAKLGADHKAAGLAHSANELYNAYGEDGDVEKAEIAQSLLDYYTTQAKFEARENEEDLTLESVYDDMGFIKAPVMDENGITAPSCSTQQYLVEAAEKSMEENYTTEYLTEQKVTDSYKKSPQVKSVSFKERFKPKTQSQLEEIRRYGL